MNKPTLRLFYLVYAWQALPPLYSFKQFSEDLIFLREQLVCSVTEEMNDGEFVSLPH